MKSLNLKSKTIISLCLFVLVFVALILIASFLDYQVSEILTKNALKDGNYLADDLYGVVGEAIGTSPIYLLISACTAILCWYFVKCFDGKDKKWATVLAVVFAVAGIVAWWFYFKDIFKYVLEHAGAEVSGAEGGIASGTPVYEYRHEGALVAIEVLIAITVQALTLMAFRPLKAETLKKLLWWVVASAAACIVANIIIMLVKDPIGRMRFRAINSDVGQALINSGEVNGYTPWYIRNGQPDDSIIDLFVQKYPGAKDAFKSFPSGHTCAAGMSYALIMLPDVVEFKHKKSAKIACWATPIAITMLVAISRIVVGAHYMSDVTFGGTLAFVSFILAREIFVCKGSHFFALFPSLTPKKLVAANNAENVENVESVENVEAENNLAGEEQTLDMATEIAISSEESDVVSKEIADNLRDGGIIE